MTRATLLLTTLLATLSLGVAAQDTTDGATGGGMGTGDTQTRTFTELDANNDGMLDEDEVSQGDVSGDFDEIDSNGDGQVDRNEYYQHQRQQN